MWRIWVDLGPDPVTGKRRQRTQTVYGTEAEAEAERSILVGKIAAGDYIDPARATVAEFAARWLEAIAPTIRPTTLDSYRQKLRTASRWIGDRRLSDLTGQVLTEMYGRMVKELSAQTVVHVHRVLRRMLSDAVKWEVLASNPAAVASPPRVTRRRLVTWTAGQVRVFLEEMEGDELSALWRLAATTGMRRGEICGLRWPVIDLDSGVLEVTDTVVMVGGRPQPSEPKTSAGRRRIALDEATVTALEDHQDRQEVEREFFADAYQDGGWVFAWPDGRPCSPNWVGKRYRRLVRAMDLPYIRFHDLRHTWATLALEASVPAKVVADRLGHAGIAITLDTYTHHVEHLDRDAAARVADLIG